MTDFLFSVEMTLFFMGMGGLLSTFYFFINVKTVAAKDAEFFVIGIVLSLCFWLTAALIRLVGG